jgi:oxygen-dependent protoporphyrinogen oxidase
MRVVIVGAGVSGLTAAYRFREHGVDVSVIEAADQVGGKLRSVRVGGLDVPAGADSFVARKPWAVELCSALDLELAAPTESGAWLWTTRGLVPYPTGTAFGIPGDVGDVLRWPGVSRKGRWRALADLIRAKRRGDADETLGALLRRRLGDEVTEAAVAPLLAGLFAGDVDKLSVAATFPELAGWEKAQGSLIRGAQAATRPGRRPDPGPMFLRPRRGVQELTDTLAELLGDRVRSGLPATSIERTGGGWRVGTTAGVLDADVVVLACDLDGVRSLVGKLAPAAINDLAAIRLVSTAVVLMVYPDGTAETLPKGSGFVVPRDAAPFTACTWLSSKWKDPSFGSRAVLRCFVGADGSEDVLEAADEELVEACERHLAALLPLPGTAEATSVVRWPRSMPQYDLGHLERVERIRDALPAGIFITGQAFDGVGVADCVRAAATTVQAVMDMSETRGSVR